MTDTNRLSRTPAQRAAATRRRNASLQAAREVLASLDAAGQRELAREVLVAQVARSRAEVLDLAEREPECWVPVAPRVAELASDLTQMVERARRDADYRQQQAGRAVRS